VVLVDTSIGIDFFQNPESVPNEKLEKLIRDSNRAVICGIILQEILQGIKDERSYLLTKDRLSRFPFIDTKKKPISKHPLFTKDRYFKIIARHSELKLY
jgi:predicted nucleic acid-binding protein